MIAFFVALILLTIAFVWFSMSMKSWLITATIVMGAGLLTGMTNWFLSLVAMLVIVPLLIGLFYAPNLRRKYLTGPLYKMVKGAMPPISQTEQDAIDAGTVWWDAELFAGKPDWSKLMTLPKPMLNQEERAFIEGPVEELCEMSDDWDISHVRNDLPEEVWQYIKEQRFFGLNASKDYNGHGFSAYAQSCIVQKLSTRSGSVAVTVMVPNSLGPAELLYHYGTQEQKDYYLPRLAEGKEVPCFGLTNPWAGSDAAGMPDSGVVCMGTHNGEEVLGFRINWEKRYITLGPVATLLGLAFKAYDPDKLLGENHDLGITCVLIPTDTEGVSIGTRHLPLNASFQNGPNWGKDVFVPLEWVIGGRERIGQGWRMLMESLAAGRGISLPAAGAGAAKVAARTSGAYARIREQFGLEIGKFEGIEEVLGRIGGLTYLLDAGRIVMTSVLALGEKPAIMSAIVKQQCTDLSRMVVNHAMDLHGGKGICMGPGNYLARAYQQIPIGITVEGANILTRSLIIFGQGALRCHPYLLTEVNAVNNPDVEQGKQDFDQAMRNHIQYVMANKMRSFTFGLSRGLLSKGTGQGVVLKYSRRIEHLSASFAWLSDMTLIVLGGDLKRKEMLSGRFADALSNLYLASSALKRYKDNGEDEKETPLLEWACQYSLYQAQQAIDGILRNFPVRFLGGMMRIAIFPTGRYLQLPDDELNQAVARILQQPGEVRDRLTEDMYISDSEEEITAQIETALGLSIKSADLRKRLKKEGFEQTADIGFEDWLGSLTEAGTISPEESELLRQTRDSVSKVINVDAFPQSKVKSEINGGAALREAG
jgi:acyl-CoA dehydrogenase